MTDTASGKDTKVRPTAEDIERSQIRIAALRKRKLPQMVNWWDASVLALVGMRTLISGTIGNYADQRPMQAAADNVTDAELQIRHDYRDVKRDGVEHFKVNGVDRVTPAVSDGDGRWSITTTDEYGTIQKRSLGFDKNEALWVDFIADLGDGYEATYAMAYLMAQDSIELPVRDADGKLKKEVLPAGDLLIMGGDLAYPNATIKEYNTRCIEPYDDAFQLKEDEPAPRKLFFIAGNHDWYDGLAAFTSVFCTARDRHAGGKGLKVGGWQAEQRRSYFALALPHGWWFWGVDLALNATIDEAQKNYFETMSERTRPGEKIIIIVHAPVWQYMPDSPLHEVSQWARENGAEVVALMAGDLHFYSRFRSIKPDKPTEEAPALPQDLQLIVSGGGGAFLHPTHQVPRKMKVHWTIPKPSKPLPLDHKGDFKDATATVRDDDGPIFDKARPFDFHAPHIYPSKGRSMMLSLKNLLLPFHNRKFALFMGVFYLVYAWVFQISTLDPQSALERARADNSRIECNTNFEDVKQREKCMAEGRNQLKVDRAIVAAAQVDKTANEAARPSRSAAIAAATASAASEADKGLPRKLPIFGRPMVEYVAQSKVLGGPDSAKDLEDALAEFESRGGVTGIAIRTYYDRILPRIDSKHVIYAMLSNPAFFFMIIGLYAGLIYYVGFEDGNFVRPNWLKWPVKAIVGFVHGWLHILALLSINGALQGIYQYYTDIDRSSVAMVFGVSIYSLLVILIGGIVGGMIFGLYWVLTSIVGRLHMDSFGALGIANYKNFLRLRVEKDKITVYAIGMQSIPGRRGWRALDETDDAGAHNPLIRPRSPLQPHLIEPPYEIRATANPKPPQSEQPAKSGSDQSAPPAGRAPALQTAGAGSGGATWRSLWS